MNTYKSPKYSPDLVEKAYVRYSQTDGNFHFIEVNKERYDIRQGIIEASWLSPEVQIEARKRSGVYPSYVEVDISVTLRA